MQQLLVFSLGKGFYGLDISDVTEIIKVQKINKIPRSNKRVLGITDVRGKISTVLDLPYILDIPVEEDAGYFIIVTSQDGRQFIFPVTDVVNIKDLEEGDFLHQTSSLVSSQYVSGYVRNNDDIVVILKLENLLSNEDFFVGEIEETEKVEE